MRLRLDLAYDGTDFHGWATQPGLRTVQETLETWTTQVLRLPTPSRLVVAGRTDAGVHATGQVAHLDVPADWSMALRDGTDAEVAEILGHRLQRVLPDDLVIHRVTTVGDDFDARFSAVWRSYEYRLWDDLTQRDPRLRRRAASVRGALDVDLMNQGAETLLGLHDFAAFCKPREGATTIRTLQQLHAERLEDGEVLVRVRADAFCHSMVRSLVGALTGLGATSTPGPRPPRITRDQDWLADLLTAPSRDSSVLKMPSSGLTLVEVGYPPAQEWARRAARARHKRNPSEVEQS